MADAGHTVAIDHLPGETRAALVDADGRLVEVVVERTSRRSLVGTVYLGRVAAVKPGLEAAFVDIGEERHGFLALPDARPPEVEGGDHIADHVSEGDAVVVQAYRDPVEDKGARLTMKPGIAGRYLVLGAGRPGAHLSRRIEDAEVRRLLRDVLDASLDEDESVVVRTAAATASDEALAAELDRLRAVHRRIDDARAGARAPAVLDAPPGLAEQALLNWAGEDIARIVVDDPAYKAQLRRMLAEAAPDLAHVLHGHAAAAPLFEDLDLEAQIEAALAPVVRLPSGGSLIVAETPALTAIDVNSGGGGGRDPERSALETNLEAVDAVARELRRRNLAGLIVIDVVPMRDRANGHRVVERLRTAAAADPASPHIAGYTRFGLIELTRRRRHPPLAAVLAPTAAGPGRSAATVAFDALRRLPAEARTRPGRALVLHVAPAVAAALTGDAAGSCTKSSAKGRRPWHAE